MPEKILYQGEHLWAGNLGFLLTAVLFASALLSCVSYLLSDKHPSYLSVARIFLVTHFIAAVSIFALILFMIANHYFEYQYVWQHSNKSMNMQFLLSCLWEGQEGSFLLWIFWQALISLVIYRKLGTMEPITMGVMMMVQAFLSTMILGTYVGDVKLGSSLFLLMREHKDFMNMPFLQNSNYLQTLDGRGLNPLLANYWMTFHPPALFLGFASTLVPFAMAIYGLVKNDYQSWLKIGNRWAFFSVMILGIGILMGGAWAYEALSFGGFWAWDPVENSSLVPWLIMVAASHSIVINLKNKGKSGIFATHFYSVSAFILVLYSTFLTRSGILGNASVHAFTDLGMQGQLFLFITFFIMLVVWAFQKNKLLKIVYIASSALFLALAIIIGYKKIFLLVWSGVSVVSLVISYQKYYQNQKEENSSSKEFWIFIGAMLFFIASMIIIYFTSIPVINKLFGFNKAPISPLDYNRWMVPVSVFIFLIIGFSQYLKYKKTDFSKLKKVLLIQFIITLLLTSALVFIVYYKDSTATTIDKLSYCVLIFSTIYAVAANVNYWLNTSKKNKYTLPAAVAHSGFALLILGALISTSRKTAIKPFTESTGVSSLSKDFDKRKSILLTQGDTVKAGHYFLVYNKKEREGQTVYFKVDYFSETKSGQKKLEFTLYPKVQDSPTMGKAADPDTKHFLFYDIYTHITYADLNDTEKTTEDTEPTNYKGHVKDTIFAQNAIVIIDSVYANKTYKEFEKNTNDLEITIVMKAVDVSGRIYKAHPKYVIKDNTVFPTTAVIDELGLKFTVWKLYPASEEIEIAMSENTKKKKDFIVMEASIFPMINLLWLGCAIMTIGLLMFLIQKVRK